MRSAPYLPDARPGCPGFGRATAPTPVQAPDVRRDTSSGLPNLDLLRALAVLLVLADHVLEVLAHQTGVSVHPYDLNAGHLGVLLFFVHTSYVLMSSMERLDLRGTSLLRSFYLRRAFRIFPLSVATVLAVVALRIPALPWSEYVPPDGMTLLSNLSLTMNLSYSFILLGPLWSLPVELQMYLVLPVIYLCLGSGRSRTRVLGVYVAALAFAWILTPFGKRFAVFEFAPCFVAGIIAWAFAGDTTPGVDGRAVIPILGALVLVYLLVAVRIGGIHPAPLAWSICLAVGLTLPHLRQSPVRSLNAVAHWVAKYSYGIYLFHCIALYYGCYALHAPVVVQWSVALTLLTALSWGGYHLLERPMIVVGARLASRQASDAHTRM